VFEAISNMEHNKAPGLDGFSAKFYQMFWQVINVDVMAMFVQLKDGDTTKFQCHNDSTHEEDVSRKEQYMPICLVNISFIFFTKLTLIEPVTWVRMPGPIALVPLIYIQVKAHKDYGPSKEPMEERFEYKN
jgi:hypothetical protein